MEPGGYSYRRLERERLARENAREHRRRLLRYLASAGLFLVLAATVAAATYGLFFVRTFPLGKLLGIPGRLISVVLLVNGVPDTVLAQGTFAVSPGDMVRVDTFRTESRFAWGVGLRSDQFPAERLLEGPCRMGDFWPNYDYAAPLTVPVDVTAGPTAIGRFYLTIHLGAHDWVERSLAVGDISAKIQYLERAARLAPQNALILLNLGRLYSEKGQWAKAAATYETLAVSSPTREVRERQVEAYEKAGNVDKALETYLKLIETSGSDPEPLSRFMAYLTSKKSPRDATTYLAEKVESFPQARRPDVQEHLGVLLAEQGRWKEAVDAYEKAIAGGVHDPRIDLKLGEAYSRLGDYGSAERILISYVTRKPEDRDGKLLLAKVYQGRKSYEQAVRLLKELLKANPNDLDLHVALAHAYEKAKMKREAAAAYEEVTALRPADKEAQRRKGILYFEMKQFGRAAKAFSEVARIDSKDVDSREYLFRIYTDQKNPSQALAVLEELIRLRPTHWEYYPQAFALYNRLGAYDEMTRTFGEAVERAPERGELRYFLGVSYEKRGFLVQGREQLEAAVKISPRNKDYLKHLAAVSERLGEEDAALAAYGKVVEIEPNDREAQESYVHLKVRKLLRSGGK
jgi:tetratricopeptide (TPR) repeat protein